jgi:hypothetical protein
MPVSFPPPERLETIIPAPDWLGDERLDDLSATEGSLPGFFDHDSSDNSDAEHFGNSPMNLDDGDEVLFFESMREINGDGNDGIPSVTAPLVDFEKSMTLSDLLDDDDDVDFHSASADSNEANEVEQKVTEHLTGNLIARVITAVLSRLRGVEDDTDDDTFGMQNVVRHESATNNPGDETRQSLMNHSTVQESARGGAIARYSGV